MTSGNLDPVILLGATGTIGHAVLRDLQSRGIPTCCFLRADRMHDAPDGVTMRNVDFTDIDDLAEQMRASSATTIISCMASRTGRPREAWAVDYAAHAAVLAAALQAGIRHFILLSAICVQKPLLEFQQAKRAFEIELQDAPLRWSIVRPTAFFKSLSGQVKRVQSGKPFLLFGNGELTACKPISDRDLARFIVGCRDAPDRWNRVLPIGGPGPALTPRVQGEMMFDLLGKPARFRRFPITMMDAIVATLTGLGRLSPAMSDKASLARIGRYYATESMLVWDDTAMRYDADATPEFGSDTLRSHYIGLMRGDGETDLGAHSVF